MNNNNFLKKIFKLPLPLKERVFMFFRFVSAPFFEIEKLVNAEANILDVGCGHGLFELVLNDSTKKRKILAIDPDKNKIFYAKKIEKLLINTKFDNISISQLNNSSGKFDCVVIFDVDYLLENKEKIKILKKTKELLNKDGILILKTVIKDNSIGYYLGYLQEILTVSLFRKTFTKNEKFSFLSIKEYKKLLLKSGLNVKKEGKLKTFFYHPHYYFVAKK